MISHQAAGTARRDPVPGCPPIPFARADITDGDIAAVAEVMRTGWITTGEVCELLEQELSDYLQVEHVVAVSSCTAGLEICFARLGLPPGARVGVPTWTFAASALVPARHGAVPVLLDVDPDTLNVSTTSLAKAVASLDAIVVVHFGGTPVGAEILDACANAGVAVVEDAAHAFGATDRRGFVAGQGTAGAAFSFYATKNLTCAEGGALATDDDELAAFARTFRLHGLSRGAWARYLPDGAPLYDVEEPGIKGNLPDVLAALARSQLARFADMQAGRRRAVRRYRDNLADVDGLGLVPSRFVEGSADHLMVVLLPEGVDRAGVVTSMSARGIGTSVHFQPLHELSWFGRNCEIGPGGVPAATRLAPRVLSLPLYSLLAPADVDRVSEALLDAIGSS